MIRDARQSAGLSQTELARRADVAQSVISAYENDQREPGLAMLTKLIEAAGHSLVVRIEPTPGMRKGLPDTPLGRRLRRHRRAINALANAHGARNVRVFGSVARGDDDEHSDVDLLVDLSSDVGLVGLATLTREIGNILGVPVDVVPADMVKAGLQPDVFAEAIPL